MPLGMTRSFFDRAPYHLLDHRSHSYERTDTGLQEQRFDFDTGITVSNGGLNAPLGDMAKWLAFLIGGPDTAVLKRSSLGEMFTPSDDRFKTAVSGPPIRNASHFAMSPSGAFRPPFETVMPVSKSNRCSCSPVSVRS